MSQGGAAIGITINEENDLEQNGGLHLCEWVLGSEKWEQVQAKECRLPDGNAFFTHCSHTQPTVNVICMLAPLPSRIARFDNCSRLPLTSGFLKNLWSQRGRTTRT